MLKKAMVLFALFLLAGCTVPPAVAETPLPPTITEPPPLFVSHPKPRLSCRQQQLFKLEFPITANQPFRVHFIDVAGGCDPDPNDRGEKYTC